jgi:hypothetical protein
MIFYSTRIILSILKSVLITLNRMNYCILGNRVFFVRGNLSRDRTRDIGFKQVYTQRKKFNFEYLITKIYFENELMQALFIKSSFHFALPANNLTPWVLL